VTKVTKGGRKPGQTIYLSHSFKSLERRLATIERTMAKMLAEVEALSKHMLPSKKRVLVSPTPEVAPPVVIRERVDKAPTPQPTHVVTTVAKTHKPTVMRSIEDFKAAPKFVDNADIASVTMTIEGSVLKRKIAALMRYSGVKDVHVGTRHNGSVKQREGAIKYHRDTSTYCFLARAVDSTSVVDLFVYPESGRREDVLRFLETLQ